VRLECLWLRLWLLLLLLRTGLFLINPGVQNLKSPLVGGTKNVLPPRSSSCLVHIVCRPRG